MDAGTDVRDLPPANDDNVDEDADTEDEEISEDGAGGEDDDEGIDNSLLDVRAGAVLDNGTMNPVMYQNDDSGTVHYVRPSRSCTFMCGRAVGVNYSQLEEDSPSKLNLSSHCSYCLRASRQ
eukprot:4889619-Karenia_brevis.AAC.1